MYEGLRNKGLVKWQGYKVSGFQGFRVVVTFGIINGTEAQISD